MVISRVKRKFPVAVPLLIAALLTVILSFVGVIPSRWVEKEYARLVFPTVSHMAGYFADAVPFSWLDFWIAASVVVLVYSLRHRNWRLPLGLVSLAYLIFFWGWGLNYHRTPLETRLGLKGAARVGPDEVDHFTLETADSLNRLWPMVSPASPDRVANMAAVRVRRVTRQIDGKSWVAASRIKHSYLADWWFRMAGVDGVFNPFGHEPILAGGIPSFELPFLMAHELAHVQGIADEGDANFIAFLSTVESNDPGFQYSGAFEMWLHLHGPVRLLDPGPRRDLQTYYARLKSQQVPQVSQLQSAILDSHLRANGVREGLASYSRFVTLAIATRSHWNEFQ
ncbi:MAG TPA: DUF3810 family protein [Terriglobia bacterium]|nr:DUF3810 family protein [Terriglobia bacterium]